MPNVTAKIAGTNGRQIKVAATATPGTLIYTAVAGTAAIDDIRLTAVNNATTAVDLTIEWGGTTSPDDQIKVRLYPGAGEQVVATGRLNGGVAVRAFAASANVISCKAEVNGITNL